MNQVAILDGPEDVVILLHVDRFRLMDQPGDGSWELVLTPPTLRGPSGEQLDLSALLRPDVLKVLRSLVQVPLVVANEQGEQQSIGFARVSATS